MCLSIPIIQWKRDAFQFQDSDYLPTFYLRKIGGSYNISFYYPLNYLRLPNIFHSIIPRNAEEEKGWRKEWKVCVRMKYANDMLPYIACAQTPTVCNSKVPFVIVLITEILSHCIYIATNYLSHLDIRGHLTWLPVSHLLARDYHNNIQSNFYVDANLYLWYS